MCSGSEAEAALHAQSRHWWVFPRGWVSSPTAPAALESRSRRESHLLAMEAQEEIKEREVHRDCPGREGDKREGKEP